MNNIIYLNKKTHHDLYRRQQRHAEGVYTYRAVMLDTDVNEVALLKDNYNCSTTTYINGAVRKFQTE